MQAMEEGTALQIEAGVLERVAEVEGAHGSTGLLQPEPEPAGEGSQGIQEAMGRKEDLAGLAARIPEGNPSAIVRNQGSVE